ncbi:MAG: hypothetical protein Q8N83_06260 [Ignavibacteria bacterium]|nr:hypothetical protein [Ignavibacteria bacterium]
MNIINRGELSFNPGELTYGFTSPLWLFLIVVINLVIHNILLVPTLLSIIFGMAYITLWWIIITKIIHQRTLQIYALLLVSIDPNLLKHTYTGLETTAVYFFSLAILYVFFIREHPNSFLMGVIIGFSILIRPDLLLISILIHLINNKRILSDEFFKVLAGAAILVIPWLIFAYFYFGTFLPSTFYAKGADYPIGRYFIANIKASLMIFLGTYLFVFIQLLVLGRSRLKEFSNTRFQRYYTFLIVLIASYLLFYSLTISNEFIFSRYYCIVFPPIFLGLFLFLDLQQNTKMQKIRSIMYYLIPVYFLFISSFHAGIYRQIYFESEKAEDQIIKWTIKNTKTDDRIYRDRIGKIGFLTQRYIVDPVGLINPGISKYRLKGDIVSFLKMKKTTILIGPKLNDEIELERKIPKNIFLLDSIATRDNFLVRQQFIKMLNMKPNNIVYCKISKIQW